MQRRPIIHVSEPTIIPHIETVPQRTQARFQIRTSKLTILSLLNY